MKPSGSERLTEVPTIISAKGAFRAVSRAPSTEYGDSVFVQELVDSEWVDRLSYNTLSNDYAYTNARESVERYARAALAPQGVTKC